MRFGAGPLQGWTLTAGDVAERERTGRGALLQLLHLQQADDVEAEARLLGYRASKDAPPLAVTLAESILQRHAELAQDDDELAARARAEGYTLIHFGELIFGEVHSAIGAAILAAEKDHGPCREVSEELWEGDRRIYAAWWDDGAVLAFERHPIARLLWRDVSAEAAAQADKWEASMGPSTGEVQVLEEPTDEQVELVGKVAAGATESSDVPPPLPRAYTDPGADELAEEFGQALEANTTRPDREGGALEQARKAAQNTLAKAREDLRGEDGRTCWDVMLSAPTVPPPTDGTKCVVCPHGWLGVEEVVTDGESFAHPWCADREQRLQDSDPLARPRALELAEQARDAKAGKAKRKKNGDTVCELCWRPIWPGALQRKRTPGSTKPMHDACVREVLARADQGGRDA